MQKQADFAARRRAFRAAPDFIPQLNVEFLKLEKQIRSALPALQAIRRKANVSVRREGLTIVVSALGRGLTLRWYRPENILGDACLFVTVWNRTVADVESAIGQPRKLLEKRFAYELAETGSAMFFDKDNDQAYTSIDLSEICLRYLVDLARRSYFHWLHW